MRSETIGLIFQDVETQDGITALSSCGEGGVCIKPQISAEPDN